MLTRILVAVVCSFIVVGCASRLPSPSSIPEGEHKSRALRLAERSPKADAEAFYRAGGIGYIMTYGGLRMPIGVDGEAALDSRDFESLKRAEPIFFSKIYSLLQDADGPLTMANFVGDEELATDRQFYQDVRGMYATRFNKRMSSLSRHQSEQVSGGNGGQHR
jgi:hypothetical protein